MVSHENSGQNSNQNISPEKKQYMMKWGQATNGSTFRCFVCPLRTPRSSRYAASLSQKLPQFKLGQDEQFACDQSTNIQKKNTSRKHTKFHSNVHVVITWYSFGTKPKVIIMTFDMQRCWKNISFVQRQACKKPTNLSWPHLCAEGWRPLWLCAADSIQQRRQAVWGRTKLRSGLSNSSLEQQRCNAAALHGFQCNWSCCLLQIEAMDVSTEGRDDERERIKTREE